MLKEQLLLHKKKSLETASLKKQVEEAKKTQEVLANQLKEKEASCQKHEIEISSLKKELEKINNPSLKFERSSTILDNILEQQKSPHDKTGIGYDNTQKNLEKGESFKVSKKRIEEKSKRHVSIHDK